jgi:hypothetical protein
MLKNVLMDTESRLYVALVLSENEGHGSLAGRRIIGKMRMTAQGPMELQTSRYLARPLRLQLRIP